MLQEKIIDGVLHWREVATQGDQTGEPLTDWAPHSIETLSRRVATGEICIRRKNERIQHLAQHIDELQNVLTWATNEEIEGFAKGYAEEMGKTNIQVAAEKTAIKYDDLRPTQGGNDGSGKA